MSPVSKSALQIARKLDAELKAKGITATFKTDSGEVSIGAKPSETPEDKSPVVTVSQPMCVPFEAEQG